LHEGALKVSDVLLSSMILSKQIDGIVASMQEYMCILACQDDTG